MFFLVVLLGYGFEDKFFGGHRGIFVQEFGSFEFLGAYFDDVLKVVERFELNGIGVLDLTLSLVFAVLKIQVILSKVVVDLGSVGTEILTHVGNWETMSGK